MGIIDSTPTAQEQPCETCARVRRLTIGLPRCEDPAERRFPLTPEGASLLAERGFTVRMQENAAASIHYEDERYVREGVEIVGRAQALGCDIVIYTARLSVQDARRLRRGAMLLTLLEPACRDAATVRVLLERNIITIALDLVQNEQGCTPFADILAEIDGRASIAIASSLLADSNRGKGILLGGVAGIVPCETLIIGSGIAACAAARSAMGLGSTVRMFDNDVYSLRRACQELGPWVITSAMHPRTLDNALRTADVVVATPTDTPLRLHTASVALMKRGVLTFDLTAAADGSAFPTMIPVDLARATCCDRSEMPQGRVCYVHAGSAVARTAAMAISNTLLTLMESIVGCEGPTNALKLHPGMQRATLTFLGKAVNPRIAEVMRMRPIDIAIFLTLS
ncbi:MAG: hypothetical protein K2K92_03815 [Duncaniella sp.]|nr:hypothetical protein [Duncaniella sp.]